MTRQMSEASLSMTFESELSWSTFGLRVCLLFYSIAVEHLLSVEFLVFAISIAIQDEQSINHPTTRGPAHPQIHTVLPTMQTPLSLPPSSSHTCSPSNAMPSRLLPRPGSAQIQRPRPSQQRRHPNRLLRHGHALQHGRAQHSHRRLHGRRLRPELRPQNHWSRRATRRGRSIQMATLGPTRSQRGHYGRRRCWG